MDERSWQRHVGWAQRCECGYLVAMLTLAAWLHDIDPFLLRISGNFGIRWYGLAYIAGFVFAYLVLRSLARRGRIDLTTAQVGDFIMAIVIGVIVGGRLGSVLLYNPTLLWELTSDPPWWGVLAINKGGMASHGGIVGVILACWWYGRRHGIAFLKLADLVALTAPLGLAAGRLANFVNGELLGRPLREGEHIPWAVKFPHEMAVYWDADQLADLAPLCERFGISQPDWFAAVYGGSVGLIEQLTGRLVEEIQRGDQAVIAVVEPLLSARHPSQLYQMLAEGLVLGLVGLIIFALSRRAGILSASFLILYGTLRIVTEVWRLPDAHLEVQRVLGLSRGQLFSLPMILAGLPLLVWVLRRRDRSEPHSVNSESE
ncbi:MAG: prolipoprotein diacylglyceryl transferase [Phycisphaerales bacterium]|nr:prolipoprotein diacylglyceryl transferase [Phycisphaerales bacterium]